MAGRHYLAIAELIVINARMKRGFTLIELSVVLVIIGLIVGGILVGRDLILTATWRHDIGAVEKLQSAINTFRTKYNCRPGDCANATDFFPASENGNGNGIIEIPAYNAFYINQAGEETSLFNEHLADAGLINLGAFDRRDATTYVSNGAWMQLSSEFGGLFVLSYQGSTYLLLDGVHGSGAAIYLSGGGSSPQAAFFVDTKIDDGLPVTGKLTASRQLDMAPGLDNRSCLPGNGWDVFSNLYNTSVSGNTQCNLYFRIDF